jgi:hypothetical protein
MTEEDRAIMREEIGRAVKETVNGKIAALDKKFDNHMEEIRPYLQAASGLGLLFKFFIFVGALATSWLAIKSSLPFK